MTKTTFKTHTVNKDECMVWFLQQDESAIVADLVREGKTWTVTFKGSKSIGRFTKVEAIRHAKKILTAYAKTINSCKR